MASWGARLADWPAGWGGLGSELETSGTKKNHFQQSLDLTCKKQHSDNFKIKKQ